MRLLARFVSAAASNLTNLLKQSRSTVPDRCCADQWGNLLADGQWQINPLMFIPAGDQVIAPLRLDHFPDTVLDAVLSGPRELPFR